MAKCSASVVPPGIRAVHICIYWSETHRIDPLILTDGEGPAPTRGLIINANRYGCRIPRWCITARGSTHRVLRFPSLPRRRPAYLWTTAPLVLMKRRINAGMTSRQEARRAVCSATPGRARVRPPARHSGIFRQARAWGCMRFMSGFHLPARQPRARSIRSITRVKQTRWWSIRLCSRTCTMSPMVGCTSVNITLRARAMNTSS